MPASLAERGRELATLRVLGFSQGEVGARAGYRTGAGDDCCAAWIADRHGIRHGYYSCRQHRDRARAISADHTQLRFCGFGGDGGFCYFSVLRPAQVEGAEPGRCTACPRVTLLQMNQNMTENIARVQPKPKKRTSRRRWIPYAGGLLLLALIVAGFWPHLAPVETAQVTTGTLRATVNEEGKTRIRNRFVVSAPFNGLLRRIPLKAGDQVKDTSMVLAVIDPLPPSMLDVRSRSLAEARRDTAAATLEKARASHKFAVSELRRFERLFTNKTVSPQEMEGAQWRETSAAKEEIAAQSALRQAEAELAEFTDSSNNSGSNRPPAEVRAPVCGRVLRVLQESARVVTAGTPLMEIGDPW